MPFSQSRYVHLICLVLFVRVFCFSLSHFGTKNSTTCLWPSAMCRKSLFWSQHFDEYAFSLPGSWGFSCANLTMLIKPRDGALSVEVKEYVCVHNGVHLNFTLGQKVGVMSRLLLKHVNVYSTLLLRLEGDDLVPVWTRVLTTQFRVLGGKCLLSLTISMYTMQEWILPFFVYCRATCLSEGNGPFPICSVCYCRAAILAKLTRWLYRPLVWN